MRNIMLFIWLLAPALSNAEPLQVFVSVLPLKTFVEKIGGNSVTVQTMVQPGDSPHTYDPTPKQISALAKTDLYVLTGVPFEKVWMERVRSANPHMKVLDARAGIDLRTIEHHEHETVHNGQQQYKAHDPGHFNDSERDPHIWTSPPLVKQMAKNIRDMLTELDPAQGQAYEDNYAAFAAELDTLDRDIRALLKEVTNRKFMVFHPAWGYFADTYDLIQIPIEQEGKEPGARALTELIKQAKRENVKVIFVQPQFNKKSAEQVASAIGGRVVAIDPLSPDYATNLRKVAQLIAEARQ
jgi:zinc transport system substrate-binding protein